MDWQQIFQDEVKLAIAEGLGDGDVSAQLEASANITVQNLVEMA